MCQLEDIKVKLNLFSEEQCERPIMEAHTFLYHANSLIHWALDDEKELVKAGLPYGHIYEASKRCRYYEITNNLYNEQIEIRNQYESQLHEAVKKSERMKTRLLTTLRLNGNEVTGTREKLESYLDKATQFEVSDGLKELFEISLLNKRLVINNGLKEQELEEIKHAIKKLKEMEDMLKGEAKRQVELKEMRNKAYTFLKRGLELIINKGLNALLYDTDRLIGYTIAKNNINPEME